MSGRGPGIKLNWSAGEGASYPVRLAVVDEAAFYRACRLRTQYLQRRERRPFMWRRLATEFQKAKGAKTSYMAKWCLEQAQYYDL